MTAPPTALDQSTQTLRDLMTAYAARTPVESVAVVGNAPLAPSRERAADIDAADLVIRMNSFVMDTDRCPAAQGRNTHVVVWNRITRATEFTFKDYRERLYLLVEPMRMHGNPEMWPSSWPDDLGLVPVPNRDVTQPLNELLGLDWRSERVAPTTGTMAAFVAVSMFPAADVLLTGFSFLDFPHQTEWQHQWGDRCPVGPEHRIDLESMLLRRWVDEGRVRFRR
jgi:hypothetical protein